VITVVRLCHTCLIKLVPISAFPDHSRLGTETNLLFDPHPKAPPSVRYDNIKQIDLRWKRGPVSIGVSMKDVTRSSQGRYVPFFLSDLLFNSIT